MLQIPQNVKPTKRFGLRLDCTVRTAVPIDQTVRSGLFYGLQKRLRSGTGPDRGQSRSQLTGS